MSRIGYSAAALHEVAWPGYPRPEIAPAKMTHEAPAAHFANKLRPSRLTNPQGTE
jgi:hypothetical protein